MSQQENKAAFFRQSIWLMFANIASGALMWGVHFLSKKIPDAEYGTLITLLAATILIPTIPLQMVFAQQTAAALATGRERQLSGMVRKGWLWLTILWLVAAAVIFIFQRDIVSRWTLTNPAALWATAIVALGSLWLPMFSGVLQGGQNFLWLGWTVILNGVGRIGGASVIVFLLGGFAAGIMTGAAIGLGVATALAIWQTRSVWRGTSEPFNSRALLAQAIPLMLGFIATQFLFTADAMFVKSYFTSEETAFYGAAGTLSRALIWLVGPLTAVMFPKIVHSAAKSEKSNLMALTLAGTAALAICGAIGLSILGPFVVKLVYKPSYVELATRVLPWYAFGMVPLSLANVLASNLLARSKFGIVPFLILLAAGYGFALTQFHDSLVTVLKVFGVFNLLMLLVCAWFTWRQKDSAAILVETK